MLSRCVPSKNIIYMLPGLEMQFRTMMYVCHKHDAFIYPDRKDTRYITSVARCQRTLSSNVMYGVYMYDCHKEIIL